MSWTRARAPASQPSVPPMRSTARSTSSTERGFVQSTVIPLPIRSRTTSFWRSENASTRSGSSARILSSLNVVKPPTRAFARAASGRRAVPGTPTTRSPAPRRQAISAVSAVRQTIRWGSSIAVLPYNRLALVHLALGEATLEGEVLLARHGRLGLGEDLARAGRAVPEEVHHHRRERLRGDEVRERLVDDRVVRAVAGAAGATDVRMEDRHDHGEVAHVGRARPVADLAVVLLAHERRRVRLERVRHGRVARHGHVAGQRLDLDLGA